MGKNKGHIPVRTCITCGSKSPKKDLLRLSIDDEGRVVKDVSGRIKGRGAYVCKTGSCQAGLQKKRGLNRIFRTDRGIALGPDLIIDE